MTNGPESAPRRSRRAADVPVDSPAGPRERESQQRARDREALRAYKALTQERREAETAPPTRRQLRLQQQRAAAAAAGRPLDSAPADTPAPATGTVPVPAQAGKAAAGKAQPEHSVSGKGQAGEAKAAQSSASVTSPPDTAAEGADAAPLRRERRRQPAAGKPAAEQTAGPQAGKPAAAQAPKPEAGKPAASGKSPNAPGKNAPATGSPAVNGQAGTSVAGNPGAKTPAGGTPETRRRARSAGSETPDAAGSRDAVPATDPNADIAGMTVEQALAARKALEGQARNQVAAMEALQADDPHAVDLELLAQQKALAERAKVLNRRTQAIQKLSRENEERKPSANDPTTAHNLAMVTPLEFVKVPGMDHPMMKAPQTSHVPIVTSSTPQVDAGGPAARSMPVVPPNAPAKRPAGAQRGTANSAADVHHSRILARADALVNAPLEPEEAARPIGARSAFGLDPLDVMTAGLGRTRKLRFAVFGVAGLGTLALIVGVLMIVGGLGG